MSILNKFLTATALAVSVAFTGLGQSPQSIYTSLGVRGVTYTTDASKSNYLVKTGINGKLSASVIPAEALAGNTEPFSYVFVDSTAAAPGNGSAATPFTSLTTALSLKGSNSVIVAAPGNYGAVTVSSGVRRCHIKCSAGYGTSTTGAVVITSLTFLSPTLSRQVMLSGVKATSVTALSNSEIWLEDSNIGMGGDGSLTTLYADPSSTITGFTVITPTAKAQYIEYVTGTSVKSAIDYLMTTNMVAFAAGTVPTNAIIYYNGTAWSYVSPGTNGQVLSAVGLEGVPTWLTYTNNVMDGSEGGEILTWSVAENRYKPLVIPGDTYIYGLTNSSGTSGVVRVPIRYGTNNQDIAVWDGYNWVGLSIGSNGTYLAATPGGLTYVKFPVPLGSNDGELLCWDAATGMFRVIENNESYTNRFLRGGTNPVFTAMGDYSSYDPRLPAPEAMAGITNGSLLYWSPEISKFLIVTGNTTDTNVFLRAGAIPTFTALPSVALQGGVRIEDFASATNWLWVTKADLETLIALSNQMVVADGSLYERDIVISNLLWQGIGQEAIDRAAADTVLSNLFSGGSSGLDAKINTISNVLAQSINNVSNVLSEAITTESNNRVAGDISSQEYAQFLFNSVVVSTNAYGMFRLLDTVDTGWLEVITGVLYYVEIGTAPSTNYQWYITSDQNITVKPGPNYNTGLGISMPQTNTTLLPGGFTYPLTGATGYTLGSVAGGFYPASYSGVSTNSVVGIAYTNNKILLGFRKLSPNTNPYYYSGPGNQGPSYYWSDPGAYLLNHSDMTSIVSVATTTAFTNFFGSMVQLNNTAFYYTLPTNNTITVSKVDTPSTVVVTNRTPIVIGGGTSTNSTFSGATLRLLDRYSTTNSWLEYGSNKLWATAVSGVTTSRVDVLASIGDATRLVDTATPSTNKTSWLEYTSKVLYQVSVYPGTNYQWYVTPSLNVMLARGSAWNGGYDPPAGIIPDYTTYITAASSRRVLGATSAVFGNTAGFYAIENATNGAATLGFISDGSANVLPAFKTLYDPTDSQVPYYSTSGNFNKYPQPDAAGAYLSPSVLAAHGWVTMTRKVPFSASPTVFTFNSALDVIGPGGVLYYTIYSNTGAAQSLTLTRTQTLVSVTNRIPLEAGVSAAAAAAYVDSVASNTVAYVDNVASNIVEIFTETFPVFNIPLGGEWTDFELWGSTNNFAEYPSYWWGPGSVYYINTRELYICPDDTNVWIYYTDDANVDGNSAKWRRAAYYGIRSPLTTSIRSLLTDPVNSVVANVLVYPSHNCDVPWQNWMSKTNDRLTWVYRRWNGVSGEVNPVSGTKHYNPIIPTEWRKQRTSP